MSLLQRFVSQQVASRIWRRDVSVFLQASAPATVRAAVANRLGWLDAPDKMTAELPALQAFAKAALADGLSQVHLLGMGGSSLCAEVMRETFSPDARRGSLTVLDTTDERAIDLASGSLNPPTALFLVASKSGTTVEVTSLEHHFGSLMTRAVGPAAGRHFVAITDPDTPLVSHAADHQYRHAFINPADIGGRYSALSLFGLVPAALLGIDAGALLAAGQVMAERCRADRPDNPGLALGAFIAEAASAGRDKLTVLLPPDLAPLGQWIEQLIAESTGKEGRGVLPVVDEPVGSAAEYGSDRAFVAVRSATSGDLDDTVSALAAAGHPVFQVVVAPEGLGAEFFRWEFATAVAGVGLGINPFDEPNVRDAKARTQSLLDSFRATGALRVDPPLKPVERLSGCLVREHRAAGAGRPEVGRYVALLDYLPTDRGRKVTVSRLRQRIRRATRAATTHGFGPRYLHSTGQYHKGGPNTGRFFLLTAPDETTTSVPGTDYSFSVLKQAQALGDFEALVAAGRDVVHFHFDSPSTDFSSAMEQVLANQPDLS
jgi:glucose-6-phosphate isomerase